MIDQPFARLVETLAARTPTPGGGAAAALAACLGTALLLMVVRFSRGRKQNAGREDDLAAAEERLAGCLADLQPMAQRDCEAYDRVAAAWRLPKDSEAQQRARTAAAQEAMAGAMAVPEETLAMVRDVFEAVAGVVPCVGRSIVSDLASGAALLLAGAEGASLNVRINAAELHDRAAAGRALDRAGRLLDEVRSHHAAIRDAVEGQLA